MTTWQLWMSACCRAGAASTSARRIRDAENGARSSVVCALGRISEAPAKEHGTREIVADEK